MAIVKLSPLFQDAHGKFGDLVIRQGPNGKIILSKAPRQRHPKSQKARKAQEAQNEQLKTLMEAAHDYAHMVMADPEMKLLFEQKAKKKKASAYHMALSHYLKGQRKSKK